jgi:diadenosine tetraphosphate (Ap4A) HIT family hydrolase
MWRISHLAGSKVGRISHLEAGMKLDARLERDTQRIGRFPLCQILMMRDSNYPWFLLVPEREGVREIHELSRDDQIRLVDESSTLARALQAAFSPDKLNIAALGNVVPQLHVHHIARYKDDAAWPDPVWGRAPALPYEPAQWSRRVQLMQSILGETAEFTPCGVEEGN